MDPRDVVIIEYGHYRDGWAASGQICPSCNGGHSKEKSMRVSVSEGWLNWRCYRDSCKFRGGYRNEGGVHGSRSSNPMCSPRTDRPSAMVVPLPDMLERTLEEKYSITSDAIEFAGWQQAIGYNNKGNRVQMPIIGPTGVHRGYTWRSYTGESPKAIITKNQPDAITTCWYKVGPYGKTLVITEDQPSALRVWGAGIDGLALCGTLLTPDRIAEIKAQGYDNVFLCLDEDATATAVQAAVVYKAKLPQLKIKPLTFDIKDMPDSVFAKFIEGVSQ